MLTEDWMMRQVDALARSIAYLVFQKESTGYVPAGAAEDAALDQGKWYPILRLCPGVFESYAEAEFYTGKPERMADRQRFLAYMRYLADRQRGAVKKAAGSQGEAAVRRLLAVYEAAAGEELR